MSAAVMTLSATCGSSSLRIAAWTTIMISTSTAGKRSIEMAPAQAGRKSPA
jgi:hypothetical protein